MDGPNINYDSNDWIIFKDWLREQYLITLKEIAAPHQTEKTADLKRGQAAFIDVLLHLRHKAADGR